MATGAEAIVRVVDSTDITPTTVDRTASFLQRARRDLWPVSGRGGGKAAVHVEPHHMVNLILALAAEQPSGAEAAVRLLRDTYVGERKREREGVTDAFWDAVCRFRRPQTFADYDPQSRGADGTHDGEAEISAGAWLDGYMAALAARPRKERDEFAQICKAQEAEMRMCLDPPSIILAWSGPDGSLKETRFMWQHTPMNDILHPERIAAPRRRITSFPMTILVVAAELVADTWRRRATAQPVPPSGSNPESGSAPDRPGSEAPTRTNQPRNRATGQCNNPKARRVCVGQQAHGGSRGPIQLMKEPRRHEARP